MAQQIIVAAGVSALFLLAINAALVTTWAKKLGRRFALALVLAPHFVVLFAGFGLYLFVLVSLNQTFRTQDEAIADLTAPLSLGAPKAESQDPFVSDIARIRSQAIAQFDPLWKAPLAAHLILIPAVFFILARTRKLESTDSQDDSLPLRK